MQNSRQNTHFEALAARLLAKSRVSDDTSKGYSKPQLKVIIAGVDNELMIYEKLINEKDEELKRLHEFIKIIKDKNREIGVALFDIEKKN